MKLRLTASLGTAERRRCGLDPAREGDLVDVAPGPAAVLLKHGWAVPVPVAPLPAPEAIPTTSEAIPAPPPRSAPRSRGGSLSPSRNDPQG